MQSYNWTVTTWKNGNDVSNYVIISVSCGGVDTGIKFGQEAGRAAKRTGEKEVEEERGDDRYLVALGI